LNCVSFLRILQARVVKFTSPSHSGHTPHKSLLTLALFPPPPPCLPCGSLRSGSHLGPLCSNVFLGHSSGDAHLPTVHLFAPLVQGLPPSFSSEQRGHYTGVSSGMSQGLHTHLPTPISQTPSDLSCPEAHRNHHCSFFFTTGTLCPITVL
jgi:hypothetical protein